jgi:hypothetical protein
LRWRADILRRRAIEVPVRASFEITALSLNGFVLPFCRSALI